MGGPSRRTGHKSRDCDAPHGFRVLKVMRSLTLFIPFERTVAWA